MKPMRRYMKAYYLKDFRKYPEWNESAYTVDPNDEKRKDPLEADSIVYIGEDFVVNKGIHPEAPLVFDQVNDTWKQFCIKNLEFVIPEDLLSDD